MTPPDAGVSFRELLAYSDYLANRWFRFFSEHPEALEVESGSSAAPTVADLVLHLIETEEVFAAFLQDGQRPEAFAARNPDGRKTADEFLHRHQEACRKIGAFLGVTSENELHVKKSFGPLEVSQRKLLAQSVLHSFHHWAQVALLVRRAGFDAGRPQDLILTTVME